MMKQRELHVGDRVTLKSNANRYHGGPAIIMAIEVRESPYSIQTWYRVKREGAYPGPGKREILVKRGSLKD